jgi:hypothetical protein
LSSRSASSFAFFITAPVDPEAPFNPPAIHIDDRVIAGSGSERFARNQDDGVA